MRYLIIFFCSICCIFANAQIVISESSEFARTFRSDNDKILQISLIGTFPSSTTATLLSESDSDICITKTLESFNYQNEGGDIKDIQATHIDFKICKQPERFKLAYLGKNVFEYQLTTMGQEASSIVIDKVDKMIRESNLLKKSEEVPFSDLLLKKPILYIPVPEYGNTYIVQYVIHPYPRTDVKYGPLFFYSNNKVIKIDREAEITKTFKLNGRYFVLFDHSCWLGCGDVCTGLLEIKNNEFIKIFVDCTWAD
jgi:hypothetical protein